MVFAIFKQLAAGVDVSGGEATVQFLQLSLGGPAWGVGAGLVTSYMMRLHVSVFFLKSVKFRIDLALLRFDVLPFCSIEGSPRRPLDRNCTAHLRRLHHGNLSSKLLHLPGVLSCLDKLSLCLLSLRVFSFFSRSTFFTCRVF